MKSRIVQGALVGLAAGLIALALHYSGSLQWLENPLWSMRVKALKQPSSNTPNIKLILIDQASLNWGRKENAWWWPWPRIVHSTVASFCRRGGAKSVVFDLTFTENSRDGVDDDQALGAEIAQSSNLVLACFASNGQGMFEQWPDYLKARTQPVTGLTVFTNTARGAKTVMSRGDFPVPDVSSNAANFGNVFSSLADDDVIRRAEPFSVFDEKLLPSLGLAAYLAAHPDAKITVNPRTLVVDGKTVPLDNKARTILNFRGPSDTFETVSAQAVIQSELRLMEGSEEEPVLDPSFFKDCYVFYGSSATGLYDIKETPVSLTFPGVAVHATFLDNLLTGDFISDASNAHIFAIVLAIGVIAGIVGRYATTGTRLAEAYVLLAPAAILPSFIAYGANVWQLRLPA